MDSDTPFGEEIPREITRYRNGAFSQEETFVATEVPVTFVVNDFEAATLMCTPSHLEAFTYGFLFTSGMIQSAADVVEWDCDKKKWRVDVRVKHFADPDMLGKRVYTSGCGKGVMYTSVTELALRRPIETETQASMGLITDAMGWLATCSGIHKRTGGVHSAAVCVNNAMPGFHIEDIGRHNAVDKVIGSLLMKELGNEALILLCTGRISSEILHKARRMNIPVLASRGPRPTRACCWPRRWA